MKRRNAVIAAVVVLLAGAIGWRILRKGDEGKKPAAEAKAPLDLARARAARKAGTVDTRPAEVGGRVIDQDGRPIPGAVVSIAMRNLSRGELSVPGQSPEPRTDTADAEGRWAEAGLPPGRYTVSASARGHLPAIVDPLVLGAGEARHGVDITLRRGGHTLSGTVSDIGGGPVAGALVRATSVGDGNVFHLFRAPFSAMSGPDGRYELTLPDGAYLLEAMHIDYVSDSRTSELRGADRTQDFTLTPGAVVTGVVRMRGTDEPVAGATVTRRSEGAGGGGGGGLDLAALGLSGATTDAEGRFTLRGLGPGTSELSAFGPGYASRTPAEVEVGIGEEVSGVVLYVDRAWSISGFVVDKRDKQRGVGGVLVAAYNFSGQIHLARDSTAEDGYFEIHGVQNGAYIVGAGGEERVVAALGANVTVQDADVTDVVVELDAGATLSGRVEPPSAARIGLDVDMESIGLGNLPQTIGAMAATTRAADDGTFALRGVPDGKYELVAHADDGGEGRVQVEVTSGADQTNLIVRVEERARITGTVVDSTGAPVEGVEVQARADAGKSSILDNMSELWGRGHGVTRADGTFEVIGLRDGTYRVSVGDDRDHLKWADPEHAKEPEKPIEVKIEGRRSVTGLRLVVEARDKIIRGVVVGPDGAPVPDAWVTARLPFDLDAVVAEATGKEQKPAEGEGGDGGGKRTNQVTITVGSGGSHVDSEEGTEAELAEAERRRERRYGPAENPVLTGPDGHFEIRGLRDSPYNLDAEGLKGAARGSADAVKAGASSVVIRLETLAGITGKVTHAGAPVTTYMVEASGPTSRRTSVVSADGAYRLNRLEAGTYRVSVTSPKGSTSGTVKVSANQVARRDLQLVPYASVRGVLVDAITGEPMDGMPVIAFADEGTDMGAQAMSVMTGDGPRTDKEGKFRVGNLGSGKGNVLFFDGDQTSFSVVARQEFTLKPGQDLDLGTIRGQRGATLPAAERGEVGMVVSAASFAERPRPPKGGDDDPPAGDTAESKYLWVESVTRDGAAEDAGLERGDRIVSIGGIEVAAVGADLAEDMLEPRKVKAGQPLPIVYDRGGKTSTVTLTPRPAASGPP
ncbi:MAG TPA: carboxypeptidase regulatory-like domain-containing protein [Kofleriaceae bacterium]|nr:carboxypeptidase regulatory-like domain-containing protein [Kofleriaceae bacterium]